MIAEHDAVQPSTLTSAEDELQKVESHEEAAHEKRNWVRLSYDCNNKCTFCLDSLAHVGTMRSNMDVKIQIVEGRKKGASRLILSGGEPTMHPNFLDFVKLGKRAGYPKVQTVTNGRMFAYPDFLDRAAENGLDEITFSLHGHNAKIHDALVATPGAFVQETAGLKAALASGRFIVNVDIVINKQNVKHLPEMLETFISWGVKEFDLLHIIPFGNAWGPAKEHLFYDLEGNEEALQRAFEYSRRPDVHIWLNRFPPPFTEGFEELIQDPYKMNDEVRGRREEFDKYLSIGRKLSCRQPERCHYCYLNQLCDGLDDALAERQHEHVDELRLVAPAPVSGQLPQAAALRVVAPSVEGAVQLIQDQRANFTEAPTLYLELENYTGLDEALEGDRFADLVLGRCYANTPAQAKLLFGLEGAFEVCVALTQQTRAIIDEHADDPRLGLEQPNYDRVTEQLRSDVPLREVLSGLPTNIPVENVPACILGREPRAVATHLDAAMLGADARIDMTKYTKRYIADRYYTKSRRCKECKFDSTCRGVHINFVRAHGYKELDPVAG
ncbi:MAG: radical SAM protein [Polyangiaceae bacterium]|nr:radical SAM protein [Polyangiaceae bacterium]